MRMNADWMRTCGWVAGCSVALVAPLWAQAQESAATRDWAVSSGDWGGVGLIQTPGARMNPASTFGLHFSRAYPYRLSNLLMQPFDDLELVVRYAGVTGRSYGPIAQGRTLIDKSLEVKYRALKETDAWPELSVGMRDPLGTGLFAGEYVVAGKRWGDMDVNLGMGWGYVGGRGDVSNPLGLLDSRFKTRQGVEVGQGGKPRSTSWFTGPAAVFGGVQWKTPWDPLVLKLEYEGNDYRHEPGGARAKQKSPVNVGLQWRKETMDVGLALERGNRVTLNVGWMLDGKRMRPTQVFPGPAPLEPGRAPISNSADDLANVVHLWRQHTGWTALGLYQAGDSYVMDIDHPVGMYSKERLSDGVKVLDRFAPENIRRFVFRIHGYKVPVTSVEVMRSGVVAPPEIVVSAPAVAPSVELAPEMKLLHKPEQRRFSLRVTPDFDQNIGGPEGYLYALSARARARLDLWDGAWVNGTAKYRLLDNYKRIFYEAPTGLPRVRTDSPQYLQASRLTIPNLQFNQFNKLSDNVYSLGYAGLLESMYAGAGVEMLYRPDKSNWGVGIDMNTVKQRDFDQGFDMRDYKTTTGHLNVYWDTKWHGVEVNMAAGKYLAGDKGVTLELARVFDNGVKMGAWATKTTASATEFGEGSFDKGIYVSFPLDAVFKSTSGTGAMVWHPLLRDGGARLNRSNNLWGLTRMRDSRAMAYTTAAE